MSLYGATKVHMDNFAPLFLPSIVLGLMPCCPNPNTSKMFLAYSVIIQSSYRAVYAFALTKYIQQYPDMDLPLICLLCSNCLFKTCCAGSQIISLIQSRKQFLAVINACYKEDFTRNRYTFIALIGLVAWPIPLVWRQTINTQWPSILYAASGILDIICVFVISMQYSTFLEIAAKRFRGAKFSLFIHMYKIHTVTDNHYDILNFTFDIHMIYRRTILIGICSLGFDFMASFYDSIQAARVFGLYTWGLCTFCYSIGCILTIYFVCNACERARKAAIAVFTVQSLTVQRFVRRQQMAMSSGTQLWPLFVLSQALGILPADNNFRVNRGLTALSVLMAGAGNLMVFAIQLWSIVSKWGTWDMIRVVLQGVTRVIRFAIVVSQVYIICRRRRLLNKILNTLSVTKLDGKLYYSNVFTVILLSLTTIAYALLIYKDPTNAPMNLSSLAQFYQILAILLFFCCFVEVSSLEISRNTASLKDQAFRINWIVDKHLSQLQHLRAVNKFFDLQIFLTHAFLTYYFVYSCFTIITFMGKRDYVNLSAYVFFHVTCFVSILLINRACQEAATEAEKFNSELFRLMRENKELCKNEKLQLYVTMKQTVNFTACGFFTLGYPLVTSIIAAATTYLVILVQFSMPPPAKT